MGPRLVSRGKYVSGGFVAVDNTLQWGRDLLVAESERSQGLLRRIHRFNGAATC